MVHKYENPVRIAELDPVKTLKKIGLTNGDVFCDIGAGTGIFVFEAAKITQGSNYAIERSAKMIDILASKKESLNADNVHIERNIDMIPHVSCDIVMLCTVLHEMVDKSETLSGLESIAKPNGIVAVIEFHKRTTPFGPPAEHRIDKQQTVEALREVGFLQIDEFDLGENFYCIVFKRKGY